MSDSLRDITLQEAIRKRAAMYVGSTGFEGLFHHVVMAIELSLPSRNDGDC